MVCALAVYIKLLLCVFLHLYKHTCMGVCMQKPYTMTPYDISTLFSEIESLAESGVYNSARLAARDLQGCPCPCPCLCHAGITGKHHSALLYIWKLGVQSQILTLAWLAVYQLNHSPSFQYPIITDPPTKYNICAVNLFLKDYSKFQLNAERGHKNI